MDDSAADRREIAELLGRAAVRDGAHPSSVPGVVLLRAGKSCPPVPVLYTPCVVVVARGRKRFHLPDRVLCYDSGSCLTVTVPVPADCETIVDESGPFLGMAIAIDLDTVSGLLVEMEPLPVSGGRPEPRAATSPMDGALSRAALRLVEAMVCEADARVLGPGLVRAFLYRLLQGPGGGALRALVLGGEPRAQVHRTLAALHADYAAPMDVARLARSAGMSPSAFHFHFRAVTATSPVQYLKRLRLHRARMLMVQGSLTAAVAAGRVGYESPSQFSREFKRLFGAPPAEEAERVRAAFGFTDSVSAAF